MQRFPIRFTGLNKALVVLGLAPRWSYVEVGGEDVRVQMAWAFSATVPRASVRSAAHYTGRVWGWGAHGWRGVWLINGSSSRIVRIEIEPRARGRCLVVPLRVRALLVAVDDPDGLIEALASG